MAKKIGTITVTETDDGLRIEITGKRLADMISCCCLPIIGGGGTKVEIRCRPEEKK